MSHRRTSSLALAAALLISLSACTFTTAAAHARTSSPSSPASAARVPSAAALYQMMRKSGAAAKSIHIKGTSTDKGQDLQLDAAGDRVGRTMRLLVDFGPGPIEVLKVNDDYYLKADVGFWTRLEGSAANASLAAGRYVKVPAGSAAGMGDFRVGTLLDQVLATEAFTADRLNTTVQTADVDGVPAYLMTSKAGDARIYVSADGQARLLRAESPKVGTFSFTEWDSVAPTGEPPVDQQAKIPGF